jgi:hypothetical protein
MSRFLDRAPIRQPGAAPPQPSAPPLTLPVLMLMLVSTMAIALTFDPLIVMLWIGIWYCSRRFATPTKYSSVFAFLIAFSLLYPESASAFVPGMHEQAVVGAVVMMLALLICRAGLADAWRKSLLLRIVFAGWIVWGLLAYLPVLIGYTIVNVFSAPLPLFLEGLPIETTASKSAIPVIAAVAMAVVPVATLKTKADMDRFLEQIVWVVAVVVALGFVQALLGFRLIATEYPFNPERVAGIAVPDSNSYGRTLLLPMLLIGSALLNGTRALPIRKPILAAVGTAILVAILLTLSRTTFISSAVGISCLLLWSRQRSRATVGAGLVLIVLVVAVGVLGTANRFAAGEERMSDQNLITRLEIYNSLIELAMIRPWFGAHPGGYFTGLREAGFRADVLDSAHNMLLTVSSQWGIPMAAILLLAIAGTFWRSVGLLPKSRRLLRMHPAFDSTDVILRALPAAIVTYFVHGLTEAVPQDAVFLLLGLTLALWIYIDAQLALATEAAANAGAPAAGVAPAAAVAASPWRPRVLRPQS